MANPWSLENSPLLNPPADPTASPLIAQILNGIGRTPASPQAPDVMTLAQPSNAPVIPAQRKGMQIDPALLQRNARIVANAPDSSRAYADYLDSIAQQKEQVENLKSLADQTGATPVQADLSPAMAFADSLTGGKTAQAYQKPLSPDDKIAKMAALRNMAANAEGNVTKDELSAAMGGQRNDVAFQKALLMLMAKQGQNANNPQMDWRTDRITQAAADSIHHAPNMKTYTDMANSVGESMFLLNKPDVTVTEAHEALQNLTRAIGRSNVSSDFRQKQLAMPTLEEYGKNLDALVESDPNQAAPVNVVGLIKKIGGRVFDTYDSSIRREANRAAQGKLGQYRTPEANTAVQQARDFYTSGQYMKELRNTYGLEPSDLPSTDTNLNPLGPSQDAVQAEILKRQKAKAQ